MNYRTDPKTGHALSALGFGLMRLPGSPGRINQSATEAMILKAISEGVNYFDTAYIYPGSERALGLALAKHGLRDKIYIATKLPLLLVKKPEDFDRFLKKQLERLRTDHIDYYFMHMLSSPQQWRSLCALGIESWLAEKQRSGEIRQVGFSFHGKRDDFLELLDMYDWDFCQIQYNYMNINYQAGLTGLKRAAEKGMPVIIMEPLLGGKLAASLPKDAEKIFRRANPALSPAAWALRWLWDQPEVTVVLSGMSAMPQVEENLRTASSSEAGMLTDIEHEAVNKVTQSFNKAFRIPCTGCNYCMPCPKHVNIPACFSAYNSSYSMGFVTGMQQYILSTGTATSDPHFASDCIGCGKCEKHCPQELPIRQHLRQVKRRFQFPGYKKIVSIITK